MARPWPSAGQPQQLLVAVGEVVVLVVGDHLDRLAHLGVVAEVLVEHHHLVGGALFGDPAVGEVGDDVELGERLVAAQLVVRQADALPLQQRGVVGLPGDVGGRQAALAQQGVEDPAVLVLVGAVPGDLGRQLAHGGGHAARRSCRSPSRPGPHRWPRWSRTGGRSRRCRRSPGTGFGPRTSAPPPNGHTRKGKVKCGCSVRGNRSSGPYGRSGDIRPGGRRNPAHSSPRCAA